MVTTDPRVDTYIEKAPAFAQPLLERVRTAFHKACPMAVETVKWSSPFYEYEGILGGMAAFKAHVSFTLWHGKEIADPEGLFDGVGKTKMAAIKITSPKDIPTQAVLRAYIKRAAAFNADAAAGGPAAKKKKAKTAKKPAPKTPSILLAALEKNPKARKSFDGFPPSAKRDYVEWITSAKQAATRDKRLATTIEWLNEGKRRHWKYEDC